MFTISTKACTLNNLRERITSAKILPQFTITQKQWRENRDFCLHAFERLEWSNEKLIVRSSSVYEDRPGMSLAGHFLSELNVEGKKNLVEAVERVLQSYNTEDQKNQVLVQPFLNDVKLSGVAFTQIPSSGAPYYLINYDDLSGRTNTVTSGETNDVKTFYCHRSYEPHETPFLMRVILMLKELETIFQSDALDIEFALNQNDSLIIFQVRQLKIHRGERYPIRLKTLAKRLKNTMGPNPRLLGKKTIYGIMPDWNPAEMIGVRPKPLALSLYHELITNRVWADQRYQYGYRDLRGFPLLVEFYGQPYIDVRTCFNSFIPQDLDMNLGEKIVNHYLRKLCQHPDLHDKVEFKIVFSCFTFDLADRLPIEIRDLSKEEVNIFHESLCKLTNKIIHPIRGFWKHDLKKIEMLRERNHDTINSPLDPLTKIYKLVNDCKMLGTLPFAGIARSAFIAMHILRSLQSAAILNEGDYHQFLKSLRTISSELTRDLYRMKKQAFLDKYGHLRPGTYDIVSKRYDEDPDVYFDFTTTHCSPHENYAFRLLPAQEKKINDLLKINQIEHTASSLMKFIGQAIQGREYAKFVFSKNISDALKLIEEYGAKHDISREECAFLDIKKILKSHTEELNYRQTLHLNVQKGKKTYAKSLMVHLPPLIFDENEIFAFHLRPSDPTFITLKRIQAKTAFVESDELKEKIVFITSADPGYDWIFSKHIAGFVTMYGGTNSHMAIRAVELNLPAIIGAGESLYYRWIKAQAIDLDCANKKVTFINYTEIS